jgi:P27 family predicted phage terminase small subunit
VRGTKPHLAADPDGLAAVPRPPAWLGRDAKGEWKRVVPLLVERRILTDGDLGTVANYCNAIGTVRQAQEELARTGLTFVSSTGQMKRNPAAGIVAEFSGLALRLAAELGLTPVSRSRPAIRDDEHDEDDGLDV